MEILPTFRISEIRSRVRQVEVAGRAIDLLDYSPALASRAVAIVPRLKVLGGSRERSSLLPYLWLSSLCTTIRSGIPDPPSITL